MAAETPAMQGEGEGHDEEEPCVICTDEIPEEGRASLSDCIHIFHFE